MRKKTKSLLQTYWCSTGGVTWQESNNGNEWLVSCSDSPKYSQTAASYPRLLDRVGDSEEREGDRNVGKGCCTGLTKQDDIQTAGTNTDVQVFFYFSQVVNCYVFETELSNDLK